MYVDKKGGNIVQLSIHPSYEYNFICIRTAKKSFWQIFIGFVTETVIMLLI
jgi:hypothetical protein